MESYTLKLNHINKYSPVYSLILLTAGTTLIIISLNDINANWIIPLLLIYFSIRAVMHFFKYRHKPYEIVVKDDCITFKELFENEINLTPCEIKEIEINNKNEFIIRTENRSILGLNGFKKFAEFAEDMKKKNSKIELIGF